ncbi:unnamed protein product [Lepeophtheirus salmonis]|uniref:(salmon louse) hypothetical protein n=1 Tax=Lepeophtheirus salmonis TaxID=72036 RepID=A0A7R8CID7_LEPSM|nr:unnamed protein product [Lepeophtheirus salmonis]CAF2831435.1 unnamed protein product [Lepeophtheirus salmonis]
MNAGMTKVRREESPPPQIMDPSRNVPYQRGPLLGKGGFAKVYEVREPHGKVYADKMIRRDFLELKQGSKAKLLRRRGKKKRLYEYSDVERSFTFNMDGVRSVTPDLLSRVHLLDYLSRYMAKKLACANPSAFATQVTVTTRSTTTIPHIVKWWRTPRFLVMILNNTSIQINFIQEHTKIVLWKCNNEFFASFFASKSLPITFNLESLSTKAAFIHTDIGELLQQVLHVLEDLNRRNELEINESTTST